MSVKRTSFVCRISYFILVLIVAFVLAFVVFVYQLSRHINEISEFEGRKTANDVINKTVNNVLEQCRNKEYYNIYRDENGKITSVEINTDTVNYVQNLISGGINDSLKKLENDKIKVPVGTLSGINFLTGRGFKIPIKIHQTGGTQTNFNSNFVSAGINQTKFNLYIDVSVEISAILPAHSTDITIKNSYLINETVIVGEVPQMYIS